MTASIVVAPAWLLFTDCWCFMEAAALDPAAFTMLFCIWFAFTVLFCRWFALSLLREEKGGTVLVQVCGAAMVGARGRRTRGGREAGAGMNYASRCLKVIRRCRYR